MTMTIPIRNRSLPKSPRVFDVVVDMEGNIIEYKTQNIKGYVFIEAEEVKKQIKEALSKKAG